MPGLAYVAYDMRSLLNLPLFPSQLAEREPDKRKRAIPRPARALEPPEPGPLSRARPRQLWLAIHLPQLALEALQGEGVGPLAVIDPESRQQIVLACNEAARAAGVRVGQSLNAAIALASDLKTMPRDARKERERLTHLAAWCQRQFTPLVSIEPADELLLEVKGSLRLFGGARALAGRIAAGLNERGVTAHLALTPTPRSALWLARAMPSPPPSPASSRERVRGRCSPASGRGSGPSPRPSPAGGRGSGVLIDRVEALAQRLAPVSLRHLRWPEELLAQLHSMGLRTVGDLVRLPRGGVVRRLGQAWLDELDRALGRRADVRRGFRSPERFDERHGLEYEIETATGLEIASESLLTRLQEFLRQRQAAIAVLAVDFKHRAHPLTRLRIGLAAPSGDVEHLRGLLAERLAALVLPAPVIAIRMRSGALLEQALVTDSFRNFTPSPGPLPHDGGEGKTLSPSPRDGERVGVRGCCDAAALPRLIERLRARLGNEAVFGVSEVEDHRPERAWRAIELPSPPPSPASSRERVRGRCSPASGRGSGTSAAKTRERGKRPLWLLAEPQKIPLTPTLTPALSRENTGEGERLELLGGPERIETGWWDGREVTRDYFVARDAHGVRLWVYRDRSTPKNWYVHGLFG